MAINDNQLFQKRAVSDLLAILLIGFMAFSWSWKLGSLPGLHGDEAWSGLKGEHFNQSGIHQIHGMNNYTGVLQALMAQISFKAFGIGVLQLRIAGVFFNVIGLIILNRFIKSALGRKAAILFLIIISQSALFLISPRVAWEVNTFTLFFTSLLSISIFHIYKNSKFSWVWVLMFLISNVLGTYNHIIFSSVSFAAFIGLFGWTCYYRDWTYQNLLVILFINCFNALGVFLFMRFELFKEISSLSWILVMTLGIVVMEYFLWIRISRKKIPEIGIDINSMVLKIIFCIASGGFISVHGTAFFEVLSVKKIYLQNYSLQTSERFDFGFLLCAIIFIGVFIKYLWKDLQSDNSSFFPFFIIAYFMVITLYTQGNSFRYYLILYLLISFYMVFSVSKKGYDIILTGSLILSFLLIHSIQTDIFFKTDTPKKTINFTIGNGQKETSSHFLPKEPLIEFLKQTQAEQIQYRAEDPFFLSEPIQFYKLATPWKEQPNNRVEIGYNLDSYRTGFSMYKVED